jgi:hypothetical protein
MSDSQDDVLLDAIDKIQWALGESMFGTKKLKPLIANNKKRATDLIEI